MYLSECKKNPVDLTVSKNFKNENIAFSTRNITTNDKITVMIDVFFQTVYENYNLTSGWRITNMDIKEALKDSSKPNSNSKSSSLSSS